MDKIVISKDLLDKICANLTDETVKNELITETQPFISSEKIAVVWSIDDIDDGVDDYELTYEDKVNILSILDNKHDASIGINWDVISTVKYNYLQDTLC